MIFAIITGLMAGATASCSLPENRGQQIPLTPELQNRRAYSVNTGAVNLGTSEQPVSGFLATPATPYPAPGVLYLPGQEGVSEAVEKEAERLASGGYVVLVIPPPSETDPRERTAAWSQRMQKAVLTLQGAQETRDRALSVIGYGEGAARALQLSLIEPAITSAVAWDPPPISGGAKLNAPNTAWLVINPPPGFNEPTFRDWTALNGIQVTTVAVPEALKNSSEAFGTPGEQTYFTPQADQARLRQQVFLIEQIGSVDAPALKELEKPAAP